MTNKTLWFFPIKINGRFTIRSVASETYEGALAELHLTASTFDEYHIVDATGQRLWLKRKDYEQN